MGQESLSPLFLLSEDLFDSIIDLALAGTISYWPYQWSLLSSYALSSRVFLPRSLHHLYSKIKLPIDFRDNAQSHKKRIRDLNSILRARPTIANYVQEVHLLLPKGETSWVYEDQYFVEVMNMIHVANRPLKKLCLEGGPNVQTLRAPESFIQHFYRPFIASHITSLHIQCLNSIPTQLVTECTQLQELSLIVAEFQSTVYSGGTINRPLIRRLEHNNSRSGISKLMYRGLKGSPPLVDFSNLRSLLVHTDALGDLLFEQEIIDASKGSIEDLTFSVDEWQRSPRFQTFVTLCDLSKLRVFETPVFFQSPPKGSLTDICSILNTIPAEYQSLTNLHLKLYVGFVGITPPEDLLEADWDLLASQVLRISAGRSFELSLYFEYLDRTSESDDESSDSGSDGEDLDDRCEEILGRVVRESLARLRENPHLTITQFNTVVTPHDS